MKKSEQDLPPMDGVIEKKITEGLQKAARKARLFHKRNGYPIVVMIDGKIVKIQPEDIKVD